VRPPPEPTPSHPQTSPPRTGRPPLGAPGWHLRQNLGHRPPTRPWTLDREAIPIAGVRVVGGLYRLVSLDNIGGAYHRCEDNRGSLSAGVPRGGLNDPPEAGSWPPPLRPSTAGRLGGRCVSRGGRLQRGGMSQVCAGCVVNRRMLSRQAPHAPAFPTNP